MPIKPTILLLFFSSILSCGSASNAKTQPTPTLKAKAYKGLIVSLLINKHVFKPAEKIKATVKLTATKGSYTLHNPFFGPLGPNTGFIVVRNSGGQVIGHYLGHHAVSETVGGGVPLRQGYFLGRTATLDPSQLLGNTPAGYGVVVGSLHPGRYTLQVVLFENCVFPRTEHPDKIIAASKTIVFSIE